MTRLSILSKYKTLLPLAILTAAATFFLLSGTSSAATINVSTNDVASTNNSDCTLREAIENINDQAATNTDCAAGDGSTDTIIIPSGTILLAADLPQITTSIAIQGAGMGETVIDATGAYSGFGSTPAPADTVQLTGFTLRAFKDFGFLMLQGNVVISELEVDGTGSTFTSGPGSSGAAFAAQNPTATPIIVNMTNVYIHDITADTTSLFVIAVMGGGNVDPAADITFMANNVTVANISNTGSVLGLMSGFGALNGGVGDGIVTANISNITVVNISSSTNSSVGIANLVMGEDKTGSLTASNITVGNISGTNTLFVPGAGLASISAGAHPGVASTSNLIVSNAVIFNTPSNCNLVSMSNITGGGTGIQSITSTGGNLSDNSSCASYFTQPTDQNNVAALAASLLPLADNGGYVPTMALKEGSPAIDSGITVSGLTTDARLALRPQGSAYDSGAYESPYTKPAAPVATLVNSGESITLSLLASVGVVSVIVGVGSRRTKAYERR